MYSAAFTAASPILSLNSSVINGDGVSSVSFWWRLWTEQSLSDKWQAWPKESPIIWISICLGSSINFSKYMASFPKEALASCLAESHESWSSSAFQTALIPLPPPPAVAFNITGYPASLANFSHSLKSFMIPSEPGIQGTPAEIMVDFAEALSPIWSIISPVAPINLISCSSHNLENFAFSDRNP